jgi:hypothetical protein
VHLPLSDQLDEVLQLELKVELWMRVQKLGIQVVDLQLQLASVKGRWTC